MLASPAVANVGDTGLVSARAPRDDEALIRLTPRAFSPRFWREARPLWRAALVTLTYVVYPSVFLAPILRPSGRYHLRSVTAPPDLVTDYDGATRFVQILRSMPRPWSDSYIISYPNGESVWRWQNLSQGIQIGAMYVISRVFQPVFTLNVLVFIGWVLSGIAVAMLARRVGAGMWTAAGAGLLVQALPSLPTMASNYLSYVFLCVPVFVVERTIAWSERPGRRTSAMVVVSLAISLFFDPYWFFFGLAVIAVGATVSLRPIIAWLREEHRLIRVLAAAIALSPIMLVVAVMTIDKVLGSSSTSRSLGIAHPGLIDAGLRRPVDWFHSSSEGLGVVVGVLGVVGAIVTLARSCQRSRRTLAWITASMVLLATRTRVVSPWFTIDSSAEYVRFLMPGVRFFQRTALIGEACLCVFAALTVSWLADVARRRVATRDPVVVRTVGVAVVAVFAVSSVVDLDPLSHRALARQVDAFADVRNVLGETPAPVVMALPFERRGRSWLEMAFLDGTPTANPLYSRSRIVETNVAASHGPASLAGYLRDLGVTHVLAVVGDDAYPITYPLEGPRFVPRTSLVLNGFEGKPQRVVLYEVHAQDGDVACVGCATGPEFEYISKVRTSGTFDGPEGPTGQPGWRWINGAEAEMTIELQDLERFVGTVDFGIGNAPCGTGRTITIEHADFSAKVTLTGSESVHVVVPINDASVAEPIRFVVSGDPCRIAADPRTLMVQVLDPVLETRPVIQE